MLLVHRRICPTNDCQRTCKGHNRRTNYRANVVVKGTTNGTITDFDGNFLLNANKGDIIVISFIGYLTQELPAATSLNVILKDDTETLEEVVVIGYGVAKKNDLTGSVTAMKPDGKNKGLVINAQDMISGKIAGVNVTSNDGAPGSGAQIRIRGGSSLNASNDPLIVIDGMAMDNEGVKGLSNKLAMINPQDIESFNVLKDASATAIYGSRGSNGVIIITTKKGRKGQKPSVSYSGSVTLSQKKEQLMYLTATNTVNLSPIYTEKTAMLIVPWVQPTPTGKILFTVPLSVMTTI